MSRATRDALTGRKPTERPLIITRSTFAGSGHYVSKWLGDNLSTWSSYIETIRQMLGYTAMYGFGVVGADTCGFGDNTTGERPLPIKLNA